MSCDKILFLILALILGLSGCGKKGPVRPVDSDLSTPVHTQPINDCSG